MLTTSDGQPGSNRLLVGHVDDALDDPASMAATTFDALVEEYGRAEASRRWMAIFGAMDASET